MTNKELRKAIVKDLKNAGYDIKDFSISVRDCGYSTSIKIKIKSPEVDRNQVRILLRKYEEYERDMRTGEILEGGNTYLLIEYEDHVFDSVAQQWLEKASELMNSSLETTAIFPGLYLLNLEHSGRLQVRQCNERDNCTFYCYDIQQLCAFLYKFNKFGTIAV